MISFEERVWKCARKIPKGKVSTYKEIAKEINSPKSARAVGNALNKNPNTKLTPCHRVIQSSGFVGGYALGSQKKIALLKKEGVIISKKGFVDLEVFSFKF